MKPWALFILVLLVAGCGGDSVSPSPTAPPDDATSSPASTPMPSSTVTVAPTPNATSRLPRIGLEPAFPALAFARMTGLYQAPDGSERWFVTEQSGRILVFEDREDAAEATLFLDIRDRVNAGGNEEGLLGLAFAPDFASTGAFYVNYTAQGPRRTVVSRFVAPPPRTAADAASESIILEVAQPFSNHNGGQTAFGPDGFLYVSLGDGGSRLDPMNNGQNAGVLLGKLLRIDVAGASPGRAYRVPSDNPFVGQGGAREEIWALGLRNPWRFSWDAATGDLWLADVGQNAREEIDLIVKGGNYGWRIREGSQWLAGPNAQCDRTGLIDPVFDYATGANCSVTGGFVYRGATITALQGAYVYGDYCSGRIWALRYDGDEVTVQAELIDGDVRISSFAAGRDGELYALEHAGQGRIFRLVP